MSINSGLAAPAKESARDSGRVVLDVGKTLSKLSLWSAGGRLIAHRNHPNRRVEAGSYAGLDSEGIEAFLAESLRDFSQLAEIEALIPIGHGAAAAIVDDDGLVLPPLDYEHPIPPSIRRDYDAQRDPFAETGSPALPNGLNLGAQLHFLETLEPGLFRGRRRIVPWPQYWSWRLCGVLASEATSLGCHTDLWRPFERKASRLSDRRGWSAHFAPLHAAGSVLGPLSPDWARRTGLPRTARVHCGLHDSNAALVAARAFPEIAEQDATVLSTGTWFVALRTPARAHTPNIATLDEARDCLINVDVAGRPVPSARFMGGREVELLLDRDADRIVQSDLVASVPGVLAAGAMVLPTFAPGCGPFPHGQGRWIGEPRDATLRRVAVALYAALLADAALDLIGARDRLLIEGRFSRSELFVRALAALRRHTRVFVCRHAVDVSFGALRLIHPAMSPASALMPVEPLDVDLSEYRAKWRDEAASTPAQR